MSDTRLDGDDLEPRHHDAVHEIDARETAPDGLPWPPPTPLLVKVVEWASHGVFLADEGHEASPDPDDRPTLVERDEQPGGLSFERALAELLALVGVPLMVDVTVHGWAVLSVRATLTGGEDLGAAERRLVGFHESHDRLLLTLADRPWPEGLWIDRRTFTGAAWSPLDEDTFHLDLLGDVRVALSRLDA